MASYRFCRPDDLDLLVKAINTCYLVHFPGAAACTPRDFKRMVRELSLWSSSSLVTLERDAFDPVSVLIGCKRGEETLVYMLGTRPDHLRKGHAAHMLRSLSGKLAVLGPPNIVAEVPEDNQPTMLLFKKSEYLHQVIFTDYLLSETLTAPPGGLAVDEIKLKHLEESGGFNIPQGMAWIRQAATIQNCADRIRGRAIISESGIEACVFFLKEQNPHRSEILSLWSSERVRRDVCFEVLLRDISSNLSQPLFLPRLAEQEINTLFLEGLGFKCGKRYVRWHGTAQPV